MNRSFYNIKTCRYLSCARISVGGKSPPGPYQDFLSKIHFSLHQRYRTLFSTALESPTAEARKRHVSCRDCWNPRCPVVCMGPRPFLGARLYTFGCTLVHISANPVPWRRSRPRPLLGARLYIFWADECNGSTCTILAPKCLKPVVQGRRMMEYDLRRRSL